MMLGLSPAATKLMQKMKGVDSTMGISPNARRPSTAKSPEASGRCSAPAPSSPAPPISTSKRLCPGPRRALAMPPSGRQTCGSPGHPHPQTPPPESLAPGVRRSSRRSRKARGPYYEAFQAHKTPRDHSVELPAEVLHSKIFHASPTPPIGAASITPSNLQAKSCGPSLAQLLLAMLRGHDQVIN